MSHQLADAIAQLQRMANQCAWLFKSYRLTTELRVAFTTGADHPWRLIETHRSDPQGVLLRRMHCYANEAALRRSIEERAQWKRRDRALVAAECPGSKFGVTNAEAEDQDKLQEAVSKYDSVVASLDERRRTLRESICVTHADRIVQLPVRATQSHR